MSLNSNTFVEGIDPTSTFGGYASVLLQLIRQALPSSTYGMILFDTTTPDVTGANAWRKRSIWISLLNPNLPTVNVYKEGTSPGWVNVNDVISNNAIVTAMIANNAVTLAKLSASGGVANQLIRVNASVSGFEFVSLANLVTTGSILPSAISGIAVPPAATQFLGNYNGGTTTWFTAQSIMEEVPPGGIDATQIAPSTTASSRSRYISTRTGDTYGTWRYFDPNVDIALSAMNGNRLTDISVSPAKITPSATEGALLAVSGGVADWVPAPTANYVDKYQTPVASYGALPAIGGKVELTHGLSGTPLCWRIGLICTADDAPTGYVSGDFIPVESIVYSSGEAGLCSGFANTSVIGFVRSNFASTMHVLKKSTGAQTAINTSNWKIKAYALI